MEYNALWFGLSVSQKIKLVSILSICSVTLVYWTTQRYVKTGHLKPTLIHRCFYTKLHNNSHCNDSMSIYVAVVSRETVNWDSDTPHATSDAASSVYPPSWRPGPSPPPLPCCPGPGSGPPCSTPPRGWGLPAEDHPHWGPPGGAGTVPIGSPAPGVIRSRSVIVILY